MAAVGVFAVPVPEPQSVPPPSNAKLCVDGVKTFNLKVRTLEDLSGNRLPTVADGKFVVDIGGPAGFSDKATTEYRLFDQFITQVGGDNSGKNCHRENQRRRTASHRKHRVLDA